MSHGRVAVSRYNRRSSAFEHMLEVFYYLGFGLLLVFCTFVFLALAFLPHERALSTHAVRLLIRLL